LRDQGAIPTAVTVLPNLREIDFYDWQDCDKTILQQAFPDSWKAWKAGDPYGLIVQESSSSSNSVQGQNDYDAEQKRPVMMEHRPLLELWERADQVWDEIITSSSS
jgi:broad specificity phosphatase PhoE